MGNLLSDDEIIGISVLTRTQNNGNPRMSLSLSSPVMIKYVFTVFTKSNKIEFSSHSLPYSRKDRKFIEDEMYFENERRLAGFMREYVDVYKKIMNKYSSYWKSEDDIPKYPFAIERQIDSMLKTAEEGLLKLRQQEGN